MYLANSVAVSIRHDIPEVTDVARRGGLVRAAVHAAEWVEMRPGTEANTQTLRCCPPGL